MQYLDSFPFLLFNSVVLNNVTALMQLHLLKVRFVYGHPSRLQSQNYWFPCFGKGPSIAFIWIQ